MASGAMSPTYLSPEVIAVLTQGTKLYLGDGSRVLVQDAENDGFSIVHAWFGENFPLPRHTHSGDCMYYVLKGVAGRSPTTRTSATTSAPSPDPA